MCDTMLAPPKSTAGHLMLFGKNSDRQRNEAQCVERFASTDHSTGTQLECTYLTIPQVRRTCAVLLSRPFWIWGAEMGANEHGVVIGNEGLHARSPAPEKQALTGMDLVRLALERAETADEAVEVITRLLERHGQGGNCGHQTPNYYNNGFLIADPNTALVLETIDRDWLVERVDGVRSISNIYSVGKHAERVSEALPALIRNSGWSEEPSPGYAAVVTDPHREHIGHAGARRARLTSLLQSRAGQLARADLMRFLRDHGDADQPSSDWHPETARSITVCMHAGAEDRAGQTAASWVSEIRKTDAVHWVTATAAPCTSIFKPVFLDVPLPPYGPLPTDRFNPHTLWWRHEQLHRLALTGHFGNFLEYIRAERDALEADFGERVNAVMNGGSGTDRSDVVARCWKDALETEKRWFAQLADVAIPPDTPYRAEWSRMNRLAGLQVPWR